MATYTSIPAFTSGQVLTSAVMNDVKDNLDLTNAQSAYPYRNLIYNGAMQVTQRAAVGSAQTGKTTAGFYTVDRFGHIIGSLGTWTDTTVADAPTGSGLRNSFKTECTTADASPAAGDYHFIRQRLEGQDVQRLRKGTSSAQQLTLSFWVKGSTTGTYIVEMRDEDNSRQVSKTYTINAAGTWEYKELTYPADTTGAFDNDNGASLDVQFWLGAGSNFTSGTLNSSAWASITDANRAVGQTNLASATSQYWQVTGVQLEVGSVATPFEFLPFGDELARCQRYYAKSYNSDVVPGTNTEAGKVQMSGSVDSGGIQVVPVYFPVEMRSGPGTVTIYTGTGTAGSLDYARSGASGSVAASTGFTGTRSTRVFATIGGSWVASYVQFHWTASAEL